MWKSKQLAYFYFLKYYSFLQAEKDCTRGIQLQPNNVKALWRRGVALVELGRIEEARNGTNVNIYKKKKCVCF